MATPVEQKRIGRPRTCLCGECDKCKRAATRSATANVRRRQGSEEAEMATATYTPAQQRYIKTLRAVHELTEANQGRPPSLRELCAYAGISSPSVASNHLRRLYEAGLIDSVAPSQQWRYGAEARSLVVSDRGRAFLLGWIS